MINSIIGTLEERRCSALADFYLGQVTPNDPDAKELNLTSLDDLYQYLLLDSQVGQEPDTSRLAEAIACLQQYIGAVYGGLEPGHATEFTQEELIAWHRRYCNISDWAGYQMLLDYPENWLNPTLRLGKSDSFKELENNLSQSTLNEAAVKTALFEHLKNFEEVCNLDLVSGYINSIDGVGTGKGQSFKNADYYFIGRQRVQPFGYFWRKAHVDLNSNSKFLDPAAWTEWAPITLPTAKDTVEMRPVFFAGRLMVVQVERLEMVDFTIEYEGGHLKLNGWWEFEIKLSYLAANGVWSTPTSLGKKKLKHWFGDPSTKLAVVNYAGDKSSDDRLVICFSAQDPYEKWDYFFAARNSIFDDVLGSGEDFKSLIADPFADTRLQHNLKNGAVTLGDAPQISKQKSGAQFLDISKLNITDLKWIRLNSLFAPELVAKAAISIDDILSLVTQNTKEPLPVEGINDEIRWAPIDFNSAHGTFYWELFFHLPFLIAHRLCEQRNYHESQRWYQYIFNPHIRTESTREAVPGEQFWFCRPLLEEGSISFEAKGLVDPDAIAFSNRIHYRKAIFMGYVRCIIAHADSLYRRLTRDSLTAAKLQYVRALSLMGAAPTAKAMSHWKPQSAKDILDDLAETVSPLESFAGTLDVDVANLPARVEGTPDFEVLKLGVFRPFTNEQLLDTWKYIDECLWNMRHNLTIDGKPMMLALYAPPTNPLDLLRAQAGGSSGATRNAGGWKTIPHYRFRTLLSTAQNAVQTLIGFGREVRQLMEQSDRGQLEELQQSHVIALGAHARTIQEETIKQMEASLQGLKQSQKMVEERARHYRDISASALLVPEIAGDLANIGGRLTAAVAAAPNTAAAVARAIPNIFGMAFGGSDIGAPLDAVSHNLYAASSLQFAIGDILHRSAFYARREQEWDFAERQANSELLVLQEQLTAQQHSLNAARSSLAQTQKANDQAQEIFSFYKTRSTNVELYRWLLSQMATLYFQAYDAVVGICLSAQASFQYEMGDFDTQVIRPNVWMDHHHGLSAGESMLLDLLRLERMYLERNERRLELTKTISLRDLFEKAEFISGKDWAAVIAELKNGKLEFNFSQRLFDSDYPGHYCRQITSVSLSLPAVLGPYQDVHAILTQTGSTTVHKADIDSLDWLYGDGEEMPPPGIFLNPRPNQQQGISHGLDDYGLFQLSFGDERYLPFEGTGAVSHWHFELPRPKSPDQIKLIDSLTDIIVHVRYLAKVGGSAYTKAVLDKLGD
ncbi:neuraminidase-like domain-containing protein [Pseudomonas sp. GV085]|uniref:Tc toxin subunit A-related protein n=1 Tax=Pseudomonas sp. GV085 TaxID=2135756 RepID=UPI000D3422EA|nr:neuraminidase-like domain-containing protein [Pseudomonas sp. GV085]PTR29404.1 hypothetical protein C8K63_101287 [Pseudomonas sp. GV085]